MKETFKSISLEENVEFIFDDRKYSTSRGAIPVSIYELTIPYKNHSIFIRNELGNGNLGKIQTELKDFSIPFFEITNRSHFWRLFNRKSNILSIKCERFLFKTTLQQLLLDTELEKIARENLFEPKIYAVNETHLVNLTCEYHLEFEDKEGVLRPLIKFYKALIDYSLKTTSH